MKEEKFKHLKLVIEPWEDVDENLDCADCATSCQSACKTSCTVGNIPCEKRKERYLKKKIRT